MEAKITFPAVPIKVIKNELKIYLENGTHELDITDIRSMKFFMVG